MKRLVLTHKDRLLRFGAELVFALCIACGVGMFGAVALAGWRGKRKRAESGLCTGGERTHALGSPSGVRRCAKRGRGPTADTAASRLRTGTMAQELLAGLIGGALVVWIGLWYKRR